MDFHLRALDYKQMASLKENLSKNTKPEAYTEIFESYHIISITCDMCGFSATTFFKFLTQYLSWRAQNLKANKSPKYVPHLKDKRATMFLINLFLIKEVFTTA